MILTYIEVRLVVHQEALQEVQDTNENFQLSGISWNIIHHFCNT